MKVIEQIKERLKKQSNSSLFWYGVLYLICIITACISVEFFGIISFFASILLLGAIFDGEGDLLWAPIAFLFWIGLILVGVGCLLFLLSEITIIPFNNWLNKKKK